MLISDLQSEAQARAGPARARVALVARPGGPGTGVGRYVAMLKPELDRLGLELLPVAPLAPPLPGALYTALGRLGIDARAFLGTYPVWASYPRADLYHLSSQNLATLLLFRPPPGPVVVTVHDIIPYMLRRHTRLRAHRTPADRLFTLLAMWGLRRADALLADSEYTRRCLVEQLGIDPTRIGVAHLGVDGAQFRPRPPSPALLVRYGLAAGQHYLIYVGSEDPRKNLETLVRALAALRHSHPAVRLLKVGAAQMPGERQRLCDLVTAQGLTGAVHFLDEVPEADLPELYGLARLCVMPSRYEGFGFPVLEAMACGTPVLCADAASLPELAGDAAERFDPDDHAGLAERIGALLDDDDRRAAMAARGLRQAATFSWARTAAATHQAYMGLLGARRQETP